MPTYIQSGPGEILLHIQWYGRSNLGPYADRQSPSLTELNMNFERLSGAGHRLGLGLPKVFCSFLGPDSVVRYDKRFLLR